MGYSVLLWNYPEEKLQDGAIVPVYIRSDISHVYVIGIPGKKEKKELPLWQLSEPKTKFRARRTARRYAAYRHQYAYIRIDGLPVRAEPENTAKQVYRLRKNEVVKLLSEGKGQTVMAGKNQKLEGKWLYVLTNDGSHGWCFSYNLTQFETDITGNPVNGMESPLVSEKDTVIEGIFEKTWYPDTYQTMIDSGDIDLSVMNASYCFQVDITNKKVTMNLPNIHVSWDYAGVTKTGDDEYTLTNVPVIITVKSDSSIVIRYTDDAGKPQDYNFITVKQNISDLISAEKVRRVKAYEKVCQGGTVFKSSNYGTLSFGNDNSFVWNDYQLLVPAVISTGAGSNGTVSIKYFIDKSFADSYDGVLTFQFENMEKEVNFLYKIEKDGIRLEDATDAVIIGNMVTERGLSPLVLFFEKDE